MFTLSDKCRKDVIELAKLSVYLAPLAAAAAACAVIPSAKLVSCAHLSLFFILGCCISRCHSRQIDFALGVSALVSALLTAMSAPFFFASFLTEGVCIAAALSIPGVLFKDTDDADGSNATVVISPLSSRAAAILVYSGVLLGSVLGRVEALDVRLAVSILPLFGCIAGAARRRILFGNRESGDCCLEKEAKPLAFPEFQTLTERESSVVLLTLKGLTSKQCSEELRIKPSTVREYLRRSYSKLGVTGSKELKARFSQVVLSPSELETEESSFSAAMLESAMGLIPFVLLAPLGLGSGKWGTGSADILVMACGCLTASALRLSASGPASARPRRIETSVYTLLFVLCGLLVTSSLFGDLFGSASDAIRVCSRYAVTLIFCLIVAVPHRSHEENGSLWSKGGVAVLFVGGLAVEELWRGSYWFSFMPAALLYVGTMVIAALISARRRLSRGWSTWLAVLVGSGLLCLLASGDNIRTASIAAVVMALVVSSEVLLGLLHSRRSDSSEFVPIGLGMICGTYGGNFLSWVFTYHVDALGMFGTQSGFEVLSIVLSSMLFLGAGLSGIRLFWSALERQDWAECAARLDADDLVQYLIGLGLKESQSEIVSNLIKGMTVEETATSLHYSPITVRAALNYAYKLVGASSITELTRLVFADKGCSHSSQ